MSPLPPHDPTERELLFHCSGWEVRIFDQEGALFRYFAPRGFLHLQLWHPRTRTSVLTPSRLSAGRYEVCSGDDRPRRYSDHHALSAMLLADRSITLPPLPKLLALETWFVRRAEVEANRERASALTHPASRSEAP